MISISIILATCNRPAALAESIAALAKVRIPPAWQAELLVVDNSPNETTATVVRDARAVNLEVIYVPEPARGKSNALNTALARSRGEFLLFTDDDVLIPEDWVEQLMAVLSRDGCDAVCGNIVLAQELERPWLTPIQRWWLAAPLSQPDEAAELIGANMGFRRSVLKIISSFDPELGPGALGRGEEALFSSQLIEAGGRIAFARQATAIHNPGAIRLQRGEWLAMARKLGHQEAYLDYHWRHRDLRWPRLKSFWLRVKLNLRRKLQPPPSATSEGCLPWESSYVRELAMNEQFCIEQRRPRQYARRGLVKRVDDRKP